MATRTAVSVDISSSFASKVEKLVLRWEPIRKEYQRLAERHLQFAVMINDLWLEAKKLDTGSGERTHTNFMRQKLQVLIDTEDETILSRWRTIGKFADKLLPHASQLPSDRDHLYELANAAKDDKPIASWVKSKEIHPGVPVRDIRDLRRGTSRKKSTAEDDRRIILRLRFAKGVSADQIVNLLKDVIQTPHLEKMSSPTLDFQHAYKDTETASYKLIQHKFPKVEKKLDGLEPLKSQSKRARVKA